MNDFYCEKVLSGEIDVDIVHDTTNVLAFHHTKPYWPVHIVVIPKKHINSLADLSADDSTTILETMEILARIVRDVSAKHGGCRVSTNVGDYQDNKHLHWYVHAGSRLRDEAGDLLEP